MCSSVAALVLNQFKSLVSILTSIYDTNIKNYNLLEKQKILYNLIDLTK